MAWKGGSGVSTRTHQSQFASRFKVDDTAKPKSRPMVMGAGQLAKIGKSFVVRRSRFEGGSFEVVNNQDLVIHAQGFDDQAEAQAKADELNRAHTLTRKDKFP